MQQTEIFCHSGLLFALLHSYGPKKSKFWKNEKNGWRCYHFTNVYHKWQSHDVWFLRYGVNQTWIFLILNHFLPFCSTNNVKNQNFEKMTIIWCIVPEIFCPFTSPPHSLKSWRIKILKKWEKPLEILSFYTSVPKIMIICCTVPEIWCIFVIFHFGLFFALSPTKQPKKSKFHENEKNTWRYHHFTHTKNYD